MASWLKILGLWGFSALICLPVVVGGPAAIVALTFLVLLVAFSAYLYSERFAGFIDSLLWHTKQI
jgi:uncharacterized membrane protein